MTWNIPKIDELKEHSFEGLANVNSSKELRIETGFYQVIKWIIAMLFSIVILVGFAPVWLIIMLLIEMESPGPAIFKQERIGLDGKKFNLYKFRTMKNGTGEQEYAPTSLEDERITKIGKFLRRTSLDEIPQFFNVLKGDMTFIGPRPEMSFIVDKYNEKQKMRLFTKPGITGLWQVMGRKDVPLHENVEYDLFYIINQSLTLDLIILLKTVTVVVTGKGAY